jgi:arsenite transporter
MAGSALERHQVWLYLAAILAGLGLGSAVPAGDLEALVWPVLGLLLFATFTQVPLLRLGEAFAEGRFIAAVLTGNFVLVPPLVLALVQLLPDDPALRLGVLLVLLVPCTDWFITFADQGGGDARRAIAVTPLNLLAQIALLPVWLWLFIGFDLALGLELGRIAVVFVGLILLPLALAFLTQRRATARPALLARLGRLPVPLLALVVFLIAASQVATVAGSLPVLAPALGVFVAFLVAAALLARLLARVFALDAPAGRALAFSLGTRNSFVVLPIALALPPSYEVAVVVIVFQSLVELFGMAAYLRWVPRRLFPAPPKGTTAAPGRYP